MFNPDASVTLLPLPGGRDAQDLIAVVDEALLEPEALVALADQHLEAFAISDHNAFPGPELPLPDSAMRGWTEALEAWALTALRAGAVQSRHGRLSIVTLQPSELSPIQRLCHRDRLATGPDQRPLASVVYLFADEALGGTAFYRPRQDGPQTEALMQQVARSGHAWLDAQLGHGPCYLSSGNAWFEQLCVVPPRFNRAIFYSGDVFHSSHILAPARLRRQASQGRLTMNGFFVCDA